MAKELFLNDSSSFKKNPDAESIETPEGVIICLSSLQDEAVHYLDSKVSCRIWKLIDKKNNLKKIKSDILSRYIVDEKVAEKDLKAFIMQLCQKKIISI